MQRLLGMVGAVVAAVLLLGAPARAADCGALTGLAIEGGRVVSAAVVAAGPMTVPAAEWGAPPVTVALPSFCRVNGVAGATVGFELWLPEDGWNGRLLSAGSGGFGGAAPVGALADGVLDGYAVTGNDTGHQGEGRAWMQNPDQVRAWGHTATHLATGPAKALLAAYYGRPARESYFAGCSTGGAQAMEEAQFYPLDYDGIVAGAPGMAYAHLMMSFLWGLKVASAYPDSALSDAKLLLLHHAVLAACGTPSGRMLGIVEDPLACRFDPRRLQCTGADGPDCLTAHQAQTAILLHQGPRNPRTGAQIYPGFAWGSEASDPYGAYNALAYGWTGIQGSLAQAFAVPLMREMVFHDPAWDWRRFDWDGDVDAVDRRVAADITAVDPDLRAFRSRGGKLILYQGWGDPLNGQALPILYRAEVIQAVRQEKGVGGAAAAREVDGFLRLFMAPGMAHCIGGPGPNRFDALAAVAAWVEQGQAPERLIATLPGSRSIDPARTTPVVRPLCPFPRVARWTGEGDADRPEQFVCRTGSKDIARPPAAD